MFKILRKEEWSPNVYAMDIEAPRVAKKAQAGQFIVLRVNEEGERIPLTIADYDRETGKILIVFQAIGASTMELAALEAGDTILDFVGPLGRPSEIAKLDGTMVVVGGGIGVAPTYPIARAMKEAGIGYGAINHPIDRDPVCGYTGIIGEVCPRCGRREGEGVPLSKLQKLGLYKNYNSTTIGYHGDPAEEADRQPNTLKIVKK